MSIDNKKIINTSVKLLAVVFSALCVLALQNVIAQPAGAQSESDDQVTVINDDSGQTTDYQFVAEPCDSLTKLVRRAILIYDSNNEQIELTKAGIIYAETNIVQNMGAYLLDIGDEVVVSAEAVSEFAESSLELTEAQIEAWSVYVPMVDFDIEDIQQPKNLDEVVADITDDSSDQDDEDEADEESAGTSAVWWFAGIGSAAIVWYLLWRREEN